MKTSTTLFVFIILLLLVILVTIMLSDIYSAQTRMILGIAKGQFMKKDNQYKSWIFNSHDQEYTSEVEDIHMDTGEDQTFGDLTENREYRNIQEMDNLKIDDTAQNSNSETHHQDQEGNNFMSQSFTTVISVTKSTEESLIQYDSRSTAKIQGTTENPTQFLSTNIFSDENISSGISPSSNLNKTIVEESLYENISVSEELITPSRQLICQNLVGTNNQKIPPNPDTWQTITGDLSFIFSAYYDTRFADKVLIRSFGMMLTAMFRDPIKKRLYCQLWNVDTGFVAVVPGLTRMPTNKTEYESFVLDCVFPPDTIITNDHFLSVSAWPCDTPNNSLTLHTTVRNQPPQYKYMVCICGSLRGNFSNFRRFIEWMEINSILGIQKTIIYKTNVSKEMELVLNYYLQKGQIEVIYWRPPNDMTRKLTHISMANDCLYRNMWRSEYLAMIDVDETIAPRTPHQITWDDMIREAGCEGRSYISALNMLFHPEWRSDRFIENKRAVRKYQLFTVLKTKREVEISPFTVRSKTIMKPKHIALVKMHKVFLLPTTNEEACVLDPVIGALHHYRFSLPNKRIGGPNEPELIVDRSLHKYGDMLVERVEHVYSQLRKGMK